MPRKVSAAQAKANLSALVAEAAYGRQRVVIERRGKALAALVSMNDLESLEQIQASSSSRSLGALALVGAWRQVKDKDLESLLREIYGERERDKGRPVGLEA